MANVKFLYLIVGLQANHKLIEAFSSNQIGMNIKCLKYHFLLLEGAYKVLETLVCHLGSSEVQLHDGRENGL